MEDYDYLYFAISSTKVRDLVTGAVQPKLSMTNLKQLQIPWAGDSVTRLTIGSILRSLDEKIASNNALSQTLEDIAQTIFKSWFIDFDPVKAKMAGEKPVGVDAATAALFPDSMVESELGPVPKGWSISKVDSLTKTLVGGTPSRVRDDFWNGDIPWFNSGKVNEFRIIEASEYITELGLQKSAAKLLPVGTTVLAITGATLGQYSRVEISASGTQNVIGILQSEYISNEFIYSFIASGISRIVAAGTGGAQQHINKEIVDNFEFIYPGKKLVDVFTLTVESMFQKISSLTFSSKNLSQLRDALLPRLLSGKLQIPEEMLAS
jgi:type I restriction enzyme S subunit